MSSKDFLMIERLGKGAFGSVDKVKRIQDGQYYAMKKVKTANLKEKDKANALNEIRLLASIDHPNVVKYREAFFDEETRTLCTVM